MRLRTIRLVVSGTPWYRALTWSYPLDDGKTYSIPTYGMTAIGTLADGSPAKQVFEVLRFGVKRSADNKNVRVVGKANYQTHTIKRWIPTYKVHSFRSREDGAWQVDGNFLIHDGPDNPMVQLYATAGCIEVCRPAGFVAFNNFMVTLAGSQKPDLASQLLDIGKSGCMSITYERATKPPLEVSR